MVKFSRQRSQVFGIIEHPVNAMFLRRESVLTVFCPYYICGALTVAFRSVFK